MSSDRGRINVVPGTSTRHGLDNDRLHRLPSGLGRLEPRPRPFCSNLALEWYPDLRNPFCERHKHLVVNESSLIAAEDFPIRVRQVVLDVPRVRQTEIMIKDFGIP
jgi:hypothetical protein